MKTSERILIIQTAFIGDVILALPVLQVLKSKYPDSEIDFMCIPSTAILLKNNPYVNEVIAYDKRNSGIRGFRLLLKKLKQKKYDIIISPHRSSRSAFISKLSGAERTISFDRSAFSYLFHIKVKYRSDIHEIQRNLELLQPLGIVESGMIKPELFPGSEEMKKIDKLFSENNIGRNDTTIAIAPGSVWFTKKYPKEKFKVVCDLLIDKDYRIILIGSCDDKEICGYIKENSVNKKIINTSGELTILESVELIRRSSLLITNDSAPLHIGGAAGTKTLAIFGSTIPSFGFYPIGINDIILQIEGLKCRPCTTHGRRSCPIKTFLCMNEIGEREVFDSAEEMLSPVFISGKLPG